jgi:hypothetical protein
MTEFTKKRPVSIHHIVLDVANHMLRLFTLHKVANDSAREEWIFTRIRQRGTLDTYRDPAGFSGELENWRTPERTQIRESRLFL